MRGPEQEFKNEVYRFLKQSKWVGEVSPGDTAIASSRGYSKFRPEGLPDIGGYMHDGAALYLELKCGKFKATEAQLKFIAKAEKAGCVAAIVYSIREIEALFRAKGYHD